MREAGRTHPRVKVIEVERLGQIGEARIPVRVIPTQVVPDRWAPVTRADAASAP